MFEEIEQNRQEVVRLKEVVDQCGCHGIDRLEHTDKRISELQRRNQQIIHNELNLFELGELAKEVCGELKTCKEDAFISQNHAQSYRCKLLRWEMKVIKDAIDQVSRVI